MNTPRRTWTLQTKIIVIAILFILLGYLLYKFSVVIPPLIISVILAYVLAPLAGWMQKRMHLRRGLALAILYVVLLAALAALLWLIIPLLFKQVVGFVTNLENLVLEAQPYLDRTWTLAGYTINGRDLAARAIVSLEGSLQPILGQTVNIAARLLEAVIWLVFILVISFYLIKDNQKILAWFSGLFPTLYRGDLNFLMGEVNTIWSAFFRGQIILSLVATAIISIEGLLIGLPFALVMGILAGLMEFIPSIGHAIWLAMASALALFLGSTWLPIPNWAFLLVVFTGHILYTQFDLNYLIPRIVGRRVNLPPLVVILGVVAGASLSGLLGVVLAAPTIASLRVLFRYLFSRLSDQEPVMSTSAEPLPPPDPNWWKQKGSRRKKEPTDNS